MDWMNYARQIQVIETRLTRRGSGKSFDDPVRVIKQYWSLEGELLAEVDESQTRAATAALDGTGVEG
jgi:hypothetical protein